MGNAAKLIGGVLLGAAVLTWSGMMTAVAKPAKAKAPKVDVEKAETAVKERLAKLKGSYGTVSLLKKETALERAFPGRAFFFVLFRQYPVGRVPPAGLKSANLFVYSADGKIQVITDTKGLEKLFKDHLPAAKTDARLKEAARAWLTLSQQLKQDGFFTFAWEDDSAKVGKGEDGKTASGKVTVMRGGSGTLGAKLTFNSSGKLKSVSEENKLRAGPRPRCHATKLLDKDPVVRAIVEQDLLVMGRAVKPYLDEQRAKASPALRKAIDRIWKRILEQEE
jgi:hypothetical protein